MIDRLTLHRWLYRGLLLFLAASIIFVHMVPLRVGSAGFPGPDLLLCLVFAWVMRRPDYVPTLMVALIFLIADMLFQRPPGLWTVFVILGLEFLRAREPLYRDLPFVLEWGLVSAVMVMMLLVERLVLGVFMVDQVSFGLSIIRLLMTLAAFPVVAAISAYALGVRKLQPGEVDAMRQRV